MKTRNIELPVDWSPWWVENHDFTSPDGW